LDFKDSFALPPVRRMKTTDFTLSLGKAAGKGQAHEPPPKLWNLFGTYLSPFFHSVTYFLFFFTVKTRETDEPTFFPSFSYFFFVNSILNSRLKIHSQSLLNEPNERGRVNWTILLFFPYFFFVTSVSLLRTFPIHSPLFTVELLINDLSFNPEPDRKLL